MEKGAAIAFDRHHPRQREACRRMLVYIEMFRWLYARALRADKATALFYRASCKGKPWPYGGLEDNDETFFRLVGELGCVDVAESVPCPS